MPSNCFMSMKAYAFGHLRKWNIAIVLKTLSDVVAKSFIVSISIFCTEKKKSRLFSYTLFKKVNQWNKFMIYRTKIIFIVFLLDLFTFWTSSTNQPEVSKLTRFFFYKYLDKIPIDSDRVQLFPILEFNLVYSLHRITFKICTGCKLSSGTPLFPKFL